MKARTMADMTVEDRLHNSGLSGSAMSTAANAASDVWEPLLRDLLQAIDARPHETVTLRQTPAYQRAKDAL